MTFKNNQVINQKFTDSEIETLKILPTKLSNPKNQKISTIKIN